MLDHVTVANLEPFGAALTRPECVVTAPSGDVYVPEWPGGITVIRANGTQQTWRARNTIDLRPNGFAIDRDGTFLIANLGDAGGVWRLSQDGTLEPFLVELGGVRLPPANFVTMDASGRTWISVSTRHVPRQPAWRHDVADGFVVLVDARGPRIVTDDLQYTNEVRVDPSGHWLYVVETFGRRLTRFRIALDGSLTSREVVVSLEQHGFPDGFAFDEEGGIWITTLVTNRLLRWYGGELRTIVEDVNAEFAAGATRAFDREGLHAAHLGPIPGTTLQQLTSVAFGDADLRTVYLGTLHNPHVFRFRSPVRGVPPAHWTWRLP
jgi:sugar lactone lactonase YvrE